MNRPARHGSRSGYARSLVWLLVAWPFCTWCVSGQYADAEPVAGDAPTPVELTVVGGAELNPNAGGRASPVVVRVFDLTAAAAFAAADVAALFEHPADVLGGSLVAQEEFILRPGDIQPRNQLLKPQVRVLGVVAAFRDPERGIGRLNVPVTPGRRNFLLIDLNRNTIRVETVDSGHP